MLPQMRNGARPREQIPPKVYAVMATVAALWFTTLTTGYQLLFSHQLFA
jgi:hypothetical protein